VRLMRRWWQGSNVAGGVLVIGGLKMERYLSGIRSRRYQLLRSAHLRNARRDISRKSTGRGRSKTYKPVTGKLLVTHLTIMKKLIVESLHPLSVEAADAR
jgi:hypothetical protein